MKESIVEDYVKKWLGKRWKKPIHIMHEKGTDVDFLACQLHPTPISHTWLINFELVECKGTKSNVHRAIGQCLDYYWSYGRIPAYVAVPDDYKNLKLLKE